MWGGCASVEGSEAKAQYYGYLMLPTRSAGGQHGPTLHGSLGFASFCPSWPLGLFLVGFTHHTATSDLRDIPTLPQQFIQLPVPVALSGPQPKGSLRHRKTKTARFAGIKRLDDDAERDEVDEIVVDRDWAEDLRSSTLRTAMSDASLWSLRWKVWPAIVKFFCHLQLFQSLFLVVNWVLGASTLASPITLFDKIYMWGFTPALTLLSLAFVMLDFPRDRPVPYQILVGCATWCWYLCGFYSPVHVVFNVGTKDFLGMITALVESLTFFIVVLTLPYRRIWVRNLLNFILYHIILLFVHYMHEKLVQVRVPLNTAKTQEIKFMALGGSLVMMSKAAIAYSGHFEILSKPYAFHTGMRTLLIPLRMATEARNLELVTYLVKIIDEFTPAGGRITCSTRLVLPAHFHPEPKRVPRPKAELEDAIEEVLVIPRNEVNEVGPASHCPVQVSLEKKKLCALEYGTGSGIPLARLHNDSYLPHSIKPNRGVNKVLALVRQIVKMSGGRLGVRSKLGHGSTFWVELPLGVGVKVVDLPDPESRLSEKHLSDLEGPLSIELLQNRSPRRGHQFIMRWRGMVELKLPNASDTSEPHVITRTIGELSSGCLVHRVIKTSAEPAASCLKPPVQGTAVPSLKSGSSVVFEPPIIVLVVDDDWLAQTIMSRTLSRLGCYVSTAENGEIALEMIPIMSGLEVIVKLREMGRGELVIGVTGNALVGDQKEYIEAGVVHILTKPVFEPNLVHMLAIADERRRREG
ncbi:Tco5, signal transduction HAMP domain histidine kinase [Boletus edulis]|nr:Tco5, signal transduction HAMP domain histidine kinase [Boletus edulis]